MNTSSRPKIGWVYFTQILVVLSIVTALFVTFGLPLVEKGFITILQIIAILTFFQYHRLSLSIPGNFWRKSIIILWPIVSTAAIFNALIIRPGEGHLIALGVFFAALIVAFISSLAPAFKKNS